MNPEKLAAELQELLPTKSAAKFLGVDRKTIQRYREAGILTPQAFGKDFSALYTKGQLIAAVKGLLEGCDKLLKGATSSGEKCCRSVKFRPEVATSYQKLVARYTGKENVQLYPITNRLVPNFKLCKVITHLPQEKYERMIVDGKPRRIIEKSNHRRYGEVATVYKISNADGFDNTDPLNEFDYAVLSVCISYLADGTENITPAMIYRGMTGKVSKGGKGKITVEQRDNVLNSITKLMGTVIDIDESETNRVLDYGKKRNPIICSAILPAYFDEKTVNGQDATVIYFDRESPLMTIARDRKQLLKYDVSLLDVPGVQNSWMNIMLKNYGMRRIAESKAHPKQMASTLTFHDTFEKCNLENASNDTKMNARKVMVKLFEHLQAKGYIKSFELTKKANAFYSIHFTF